MPHSELSTALFSQPRFQTQLESARRRAVASLFHTKPGLLPTEAKPEIDWGPLLNCATLLSQSQHEDHRAAALTISQACLIDTETTTPQLRRRAGFVLKALANEPGMPYQNLINLYLSDCALNQKKLALKWAA